MWSRYQWLRQPTDKRRLCNYTIVLFLHPPSASHADYSKGTELNKDINSCTRDSCALKSELGANFCFKNAKGTFQIWPKWYQWVTLVWVINVWEMRAVVARQGLGMQPLNSTSEAEKLIFFPAGLKRGLWTPALNYTKIEEIQKGSCSWRIRALCAVLLSSTIGPTTRLFPQGYTTLICTTLKAHGNSTDVIMKCLFPICLVSLEWAKWETQRT